MSKIVELHVYIDEETYKKLWDITKKRFLAPSKKLATIVREALQEYVKNHS
jgi:hypothetical protein